MRQQQRGGTFLGIVIGMVIGLGAALAVAIYVTKVPVPFLTNKNQPRKADQDAAEALKNKDWDPNAALYGKNPARPAAPTANAPTPEPDAAVPAPAPMPAPMPAAAPAAPVASSARPVRAGASAPAASAVRAESKPAPSSDPLGDLAKARSAGATADPFSYFVQAGAFRTPEDAEAQRVKLSLMGVEAKVTEREQSGRTIYRVRVGPFDTKDAADHVKERIDGGGVESALVRVQR